MSDEQEMREPQWKGFRWAVLWGNDPGAWPFSRYFNLRSSAYRFFASLRRDPASKDKYPKLRIRKRPHNLQPPNLISTRKIKRNA